MRGEHRKAHGEARAALQSDHGVTLTYAGLDRIERSTHIAFAPSPKTLTTARAVYELLLKPRGDTAHLRSLRGGPRRKRLGRTALLPAHARRAPGAARIEPARRKHRGLEFRIQRDRAPLGVGSVHAGHGHPARPLSVCGNPLVLDPVRARRHHHRPHDPVGRSRHRRRACSSFSPTPRPRPSSRSATPSPARYCTRCATARWPTCARCLSAAITAASTRRRCSFCCSASTSGAPRTWRRSGPCGRTRRRHSNGSTATATATATASSSTTGKPRRGSPIRDGRIRTTRSSIRTGAWRRVRSRYAKCKPTYTGPSATRPRSRKRSATHERAAALVAQAEKLRQDFENRFWCEELSVYALALDGGKEPCRVISSNSGQVLFTGIASRRAGAARRPHALGAIDVQRLGYPHCCRLRGALQPHVLSQRLGLAARQRTHRDGFCALRPEAGCLTGIRRHCSMRQPTWICAACPSFTAASYGIARNAPTQYPVACSPQAWASAAPLCLLQASLGLELLDRTGEIKFYRPTLPDFLDHVHLRNLRLSSGSADVLLHRHGRAHRGNRHSPRGGRGSGGAVLARPARRRPAGRRAHVLTPARGEFPASRKAPAAPPRDPRTRGSKTRCACRSGRPPSRPPRYLPCCRCRWRIRRPRARD